MYRYWEEAAIYPVDPGRVDLAREFRARIRGPHSEELRNLLHRMRAMPIRGKYVLVVVKPFRSWRIGRIGERNQPIEAVDDRIFDSLDAAEWAVFRLRWRDLTGMELEL
ncbi:MAG: hypothetical protein OXI81_15370 [Paracoccaceae bacterium]|nr:hypothetical protein [Paracoccaceae bacterium]MDE2915133.1 hypothetical protein [Paracoccaceae bacterium]